MALTVGSLFSGIGGLDLGLERAGMEVRWQCENEPYACRVLARHWPGVPNLGNIKTVDWAGVEKVDVVCGGFPCQPVSAAGKQRAQEDERWLWPEFARCLRGVQPQVVIVENVPALATVADGRAAQEVFGDLAVLGFDAEWCRLSAQQVGAPHLRRRLWVVAWRPAAEDGDVADTERARLEGRGGERQLREGVKARRAGGEGEDGPDPDRRGLLEHGQRYGNQAPHPADGGTRGDDAGGLREDVADAPIARRLSRRPAGEAVFGPGAIKRLGRRGGSVGGTWAVEPDVGRVADGVPHRVDRLRCLGNAVVPQCAEVIGRIVVAAWDELADFKGQREQDFGRIVTPHNPQSLE